MDVGAPPPDPRRRTELEEELTRNFSRTFRCYVKNDFRSQEHFLGTTTVNRGHYGAMARGEVDPKLSMLFRCTREVGHCPDAILCDLCARTYGPCVVPLDFDALPKDAETLRQLHEILRRLRERPPM